MFAPDVDGAFVAAGALAAAFVLHELQTADPMLDVRLFLNRTLAVSYTSITLAFGSLVAMLFLLTQYFQFAEGYSPLQAGLRVGVGGIRIPGGRGAR